MKKAGILSAGIAMFAMMFGAGNVIFPLALGRDASSSVWYALAGFLLTAVVVPLLGIVSISLYQGDYKKFLARIGTVPGAVVALLCMVLIGPFGCIPRCVTISYAALSWYLPHLSLLTFSIIASMIIFAATSSTSGVVSVLGRFLGPIKFVLLLAIMLVGLYNGAPLMRGDVQQLGAFAQGLVEGYGTMDLLAALFFTGLICASLREEHESLSSPVVALRCIKAGLIGGLLLGVVYTGFCLVAACNAQFVQGVDKSQLLSALASLVLGSFGGVLANATVALSCLTTAIALTTVFADYVSKELSGGRVSYKYARCGTILVACLMTNLGFNGIMAVIKPIIVVCYPALIVLSVVNISFWVCARIIRLASTSCVRCNPPLFLERSL